MNWRYPSGLVLTALTATAMIMSSPVSAASDVEPQRIVLEAHHKYGAAHGTFVLSALGSGKLESDTGTYSYIVSMKPPQIRRGQGVAVYVASQTLTGVRGTMVLRWRVEFVGAGGGNTIGTGTWSVVSGSGTYAHLTGSGRLGLIVATSKGVTSMQLEGLVVGAGAPTSTKA